MEIDKETIQNPEIKEDKVEVIHPPTLEQLLVFEKISWPEEEQATPDQIEQRLNDFPDGMFMLTVNGEMAAQVTVSPKDIRDPDTINKFVSMRDMSVDKESPILWGTNMATPPEHKGKGYTSRLMKEVFKWANESGKYTTFMGGVTCDNYAELLKKGQVSSIEDYMEKNLNPGLNLFKSVARKFKDDTGQNLFLHHSDPITNYWEEDIASSGYGVMIAVDFPNKDYGENGLVAPVSIIERTSKKHFIARQEEFYENGFGLDPGALPRDANTGRNVEFFASELYDTWQINKDKSTIELQRLYYKINEEFGLKQTEYYNYVFRWERANQDKRIYNDENFRVIRLNLDLTRHKMAVIEDMLHEREGAQKPEIKYNIDLNVVNNLGIEDRLTTSGPEKTMFILLPPRGCKMNCDFCSPKHVANPNFPLTAEASEQVAGESNKILFENSEVNTIKLFNAGNILWGTEYGQKAGALHEKYWELLPKIVSSYPNLKAVELEVRTDEFIQDIANPEIQTVERKKIVTDRILKLNKDLKGVDKELRALLAIEYTSDIISMQKGTLQKGTGQAERAIGFLKENNIPWLGYAMLGGRLNDRSLSSGEAVQSAVQTSLFCFDKGAREVVINCQYLDPINRWEEKVNGIKYYVPSEEDVRNLLLQVRQSLSPEKRIRITLDAEEAIVGTIGTEVSDEFHKLIDDLNNTENQQQYIEENFNK